MVLDASALLAFLFNEEGAEYVAPHLPNSCMSMVNLSEVLARFARDGFDPQKTLGRLQRSEIEFVAFGEEDAALTAALVPVTRTLGLSLADRACLALGVSRELAVVTADRVWGNLDSRFQIQLIR